MDTVLGLFLLALSAEIACGQTTPAIEPSPDPALAYAPMVAPKTPAEVEERLAQIDTRLAGLPVLDTGPDVDSSGLRLAESVESLRGALNAYRTQIGTLVEAQQRAAQLGSEASLAERKSAIEKYKQRIGELKKISGSSFIADPAALRAEIAAEFERTNALHDALNQQQTQRVSRLAEWSKSAAALADELTRLRTALAGSLQETIVVPKGMDETVVAQIRQYRLRKRAIDVSTAQARLEQGTLDKVALELEVAAAEAMLPVLQDYAKAAGDCRTRLDALSTQSDAEIIAAKLADATTEHERAYWSYRALIAETRSAFLGKIGGIRSRYRESDRQKLFREIDRKSGAYERLRERLSRVTGEEKSDVYRQLDGELRDYRQRRLLLNDQLFESRRENDQLSTTWDLASEKLLIAREALSAAVEKLKGEHRTEYDRLTAELAAQYRPALEEVVTEGLTAERELISRLLTSVEKLDAFLQQLVAYKENLFWSFTLARGSHLPERIGEGWTSLWSAEFRTAFAEAWTTYRNALVAVPGPGRVLALAFLVVGVLAGVIGRWRLRRIANAKEVRVMTALQESGGTEVGVSDRFYLQALRLAGAVQPIGLPVVLLLLQAILRDDLAGAPRIVTVRMLGVVLGLVGGWALVRLLFQAGKPRYRVISCSNVVAQHYRHWGSWLWAITLIFVPPIMYLYTMGFGVVVRESLWSIYCTLMLVMLLLGARKRQTVVRIVGRSFAQRRPILFKLLVRTYLLVVAAMFVLLAMEVAGYATFVDYIVRNLLHTAAAITLATLVANLVEDLSNKLSGADAEAPAETASTPPTEAAPAATLDELFEDFETQEVGIAVRAVATLVRWSAWVASLVWIASAWGVTTLTAKQALGFSLAETSGGPITVQRLVGAVFAVFIAFKLSRGVRAALDEKIYPAYAAINRAAQATINSLLHYTFLVIGLYISLQLVHINLGALAVLLGGLGLGLGLGLQPLVVNFVSGLLIFAERHIKVGDLVEVEGELGEVMGISMRSTQIKSFDNIDRIIPNSQFMTTAVTNWTLSDTRLRGKIEIGVAYGADPERVREILLQIAYQEPLVHAMPEPAVWFVKFGESSLDFVLACWYSSPADRWVGMINIRYAIAKRFKKEGIEIPFPQRTLSLHPDAELPVRMVGPRDRMVECPKETEGNQDATDDSERRPGQGSGPDSGSGLGA